jgi:hypothetical protein
VNKRPVFCFNWLAFEDTGLPSDATLRLHAIREAGYAGVQFIDVLTPEQDRVAAQLDLWRCSSGRINEPGEAATMARRFADEGQNCATIHLGWGIEEEDTADALIESVLEASAATGVPLYVETHRATLFQDMWRTVQFIRRYPDLRFNGDFSHWYTGQEMVYGGFETKLAYIRPLIERVRFLHGRIGNPGCMQVALPRPGDPEPKYVQHFRNLWTACFDAFHRQSEADLIPFVAELLSPAIYYGRTFPGTGGALREEADRWADSLRMREIAAECFDSSAALEV